MSILKISGKNRFQIEYDLRIEQCKTESRLSSLCEYSQSQILKYFVTIKSAACFIIRL